LDIPGFSTTTTANEPSLLEEEQQQQELQIQQHQQTLERISALTTAGKSLTGIIFLHPVTDSASAATALANADLLRALAPPESSTVSTVLATTMWSHTTPEAGAQVERALVEESAVFKEVLAREPSKVFRFQETRESGMEILGWLVDRERAIRDGRRDTSGWESHRGGTVEGGEQVAANGVSVSDKAVQTDHRGLGGHDGEWDREIAMERERHLANLAEMYAAMERATKEHDANVRGIFKGEVEVLKKRISETEEELARIKEVLEQTTQTKDEELRLLREQMVAERHQHADQLSTTQHNHSSELAQKETDHNTQMTTLRADLTRESEARIKSLLEEMTHEADQRVKAVRAEMTHEADDRINALKQEMAQMKAEFEQERLQNLKAIKAEMTRLVDREKEARERARLAELARDMARKKSEQYEKQEKQQQQQQQQQQPQDYRAPLQAWAVARLWGVGQTRAR